MSYSKPRNSVRKSGNGLRINGSRAADSQVRFQIKILVADFECNTKRPGTLYCLNLGLLRKVESDRVLRKSIRLSSSVWLKAIPFFNKGSRVALWLTPLS
jgi:hypothetical protein